jgi:CheY-like chemotaxis protein
MNLLPKSRALLIEDEPAVNMVIAGMLDELGYEVVAASPDVEGAMNMARTQQVDIAVLDLAIEDGNTFPVAEILRERGVPFIFITGLDLSKARDKFGATVILNKPFGAQALEDALNKAAALMTKVRSPL